MTQIKIYDLEAEELQKWADEYDVTIAEIMEAMVDAVKSGDIRLEDYV